MNKYDLDQKKNPLKTPEQRSVGRSVGRVRVTANGGFRDFRPYRIFGDAPMERPWP